MCAVTCLEDMQIYRELEFVHAVEKFMYVWGHSVLHSVHGSK